MNTFETTGERRQIEDHDRAELAGEPLQVAKERFPRNYAARSVLLHDRVRTVYVEVPTPPFRPSRPHQRHRQKPGIRTVELPSREYGCLVT